MKLTQNRIHSKIAYTLHRTPVTRWLSTGYMGVGYLHRPTPMHITDPQGLTWCWCRV
ncbi:MAG: hypothetical protein IKP44_09800 [Bacteroidaceae bacterium]|nr:hypothetical protein [Bacteroidaceae bacterium]